MPATADMARPRSLIKSCLTTDLITIKIRTGSTMGPVKGRVRNRASMLKGLM
ncbi:hypothetical protein LguiB_012223 [Lonicera macranthoides]